MSRISMYADNVFLNETLKKNSLRISREFHISNDIIEGAMINLVKYGVPEDEVLRIGENYAAEERNKSLQRALKHVNDLRLNEEETQWFVDKLLKKS